jgi:SAM-dependent methyltransferase
MTKHARYQDYVIRDGELVGEFEEMYQDFDDPWHQLANTPSAPDKAAGLALLDRLGRQFGARRVVEIGCGLGRYAAAIAGAGFDVTGLDVSETAVAKARELHPAPDFHVGAITDFDAIADLSPDVLVLAETSWYVLGDLPAFVDFARERLPDAFLLHLLVTYPADVQRYGREVFTDLDGIKEFFAMNYLASGETRSTDGHAHTHFLGTWRPENLETWKRNQ